jgi:hypothetical protein
MAIESVTKDLGVTPAELRDGVFGDAVVLTYQPPREGTEESGVLMLQSRVPATLGKVLEAFNSLQLKSGDVRTIREKSHGKQVYFEREKSDGRKEYYTVRDSGLFAYSAQEVALQGVLEAIDKADQSVFAKLYAKLGVQNAVLSVLFDPRSLDADLAAKTKSTADPNEKAFLTQFRKLWSATDALGVSLTLNRDAELTLSIALDTERLPPEFRPLTRSTAESTALWSVIPKDALFAVAGRFELSQLSPVVQSFLSDEGKKGLKSVSQEIAPVVGKDTLPKILSGIGSDWGAWVTAPERGSASPLPDVTFALRVRPSGATESEVGDAIITGLDFTAQLLRVEYNRTHDDQFTLIEEKTDGGTIKVLKNDTALLPGVRPAYGLRGDFLVLATNPQAVKRFTPPGAGTNVSNAPLIRLSTAKLSEYLTTHRERLGELLGKLQSEKPDAISKPLGEWATVLELFQSAELNYSGDGKTMKLTLRLTPTKPLRK